MDWYNGFSPERREKRGTKRARASAPSSITEPPCSMCGDPTPAKVWSHAEDYSEPYNWAPPASYPLCDPCHKRLHGRFRNPARWRAYHQFLRRGWYGREVTTQLLTRCTSQGASFTWPELPGYRAQGAQGTIRWWEGLTLDPRSKREGPRTEAT